MYKIKLETLETFLYLNPIEQLFADNNVEEVREFEIHFGPRFSEICAHFNSDECLNYLIEGGHDISDRINLYRLNNDKPIIPFVSHPEELFYALVNGMHHVLPEQGNIDAHRIKRPSIHTALRTLIELQKHAFNMIDYEPIIYALYTDEEWSKCINDSSSVMISSLIENKFFRFLRYSHLGYSVTLAIKRATPEQLKEIKKHCTIPTSYKTRRTLYYSVIVDRR
jgi:hypothetical protein